MANGHKTGGRKVGSLNKATAEIKAVASQYGPAIIAKLAEMSGIVPGIPAESETVKVAAMKELLDRGYGKATQVLAGDTDGPPIAYSFRWADATPTPQPEAIEADDAAGAVTVMFAANTC